jgi:hypothetical protein
MHNPELLGRSPSASKQPSLLPDLETVPGQRVTGQDGAAGDEVD